MIGWLVWACGAAEPAPVGPALAPHAAEWAQVVSAAERGDLEAVRRHARRLSLGPAEDTPGAGALGAAIGGLQVAEDAAEVEAALARARRACAGCHPGQ